MSQRLSRGRSPVPPIAVPMRQTSPSAHATAPPRRDSTTSQPYTPGHHTPFYDKDHSRYSSSSRPTIDRSRPPPRSDCYRPDEYSRRSPPDRGRPVRCSPFPRDLRPPFPQDRRDRSRTPPPSRSDCYRPHETSPDRGRPMRRSPSPGAMRHPYSQKRGDNSRAPREEYRSFGYERYVEKRPPRSVTPPRPGSSEYIQRRPRSSRSRSPSRAMPFPRPRSNRPYSRERLRSPPRPRSRSPERTQARRDKDVAIVDPIARIDALEKELAEIREQLRAAERKISQNDQAVDPPQAHKEPLTPAPDPVEPPRSSVVVTPLSTVPISPPVTPMIAQSLCSQIHAPSASNDPSLVTSEDRRTGATDTTSQRESQSPPPSEAGLSLSLEHPLEFPTTLAAKSENDAERAELTRTPKTVVDDSNYKLIGEIFAQVFVQQGPDHLTCRFCLNRKESIPEAADSLLPLFPIAVDADLLLLHLEDEHEMVWEKFLAGEALS